MHRVCEDSGSHYGSKRENKIGSSGKEHGNVYIKKQGRRKK